MLHLKHKNIHNINLRTLDGCYSYDSSVGIVTGYGQDGPESNPGGGEIFRTCLDRPWGPPSLLYNWYRVFLGGKERLGSDADSSPFSSAVIKKE